MVWFLALVAIWQEGVSAVFFLKQEIVVIRAWLQHFNDVERSIDLAAKLP